MKRRGFFKAALGLLLAPFGAAGVKPSMPFKRVSIPACDIRFLKTKNFAIGEIAKAFNLPVEQLLTDAFWSAAVKAEDAKIMRTS